MLHLYPSKKEDGNWSGKPLMVPWISRVKIKDLVIFKNKLKKAGAFYRPCIAYYFLENLDILDPMLSKSLMWNN